MLGLMELRAEMNEMRQSQAPHLSYRDDHEQAHNAIHNVPDVTYGHSLHDVRNISPQHYDYMQLKETREAIPYFDGTSLQKLQKFLNAYTYAVQSIYSGAEQELFAILFMKLKGNAMAEFQIKENFEQLKQELAIKISVA